MKRAFALCLLALVTLFAAAHPSAAGPGGGANLRPHSSFIVLDPSVLTAGGVTLPAPWSLTRADATTCATVQTGTHTLALVPANKALIGRGLDADPLALIVEAQFQNPIVNNRDPSTWGNNAGSGTNTITAGQVGPDGTTNWSRIQTASGSFGRYYTAGTFTGTYIASAWVCPGVGTGAYQIGNEVSASIGAAAFGTASVCQRVDVPLALSAQIPNLMASDGRSQTLIGGTTAGARDSILGGLQLSKGYTREIVVTGASATTRAGDRLFLASPLSPGARFRPAVINGRIDMWLRTQPRHAPADADIGAMRLWSDHNGTDFCEISSAGVVSCSIGGGTATASALSGGSAAWSAYDIIDLYVGAGGSARPTVVQFRRSTDDGATWSAVTTATVTDSGIGSIAPTGALDVLCDASTTRQFVSRVRRIEFRNSPPDWAWPSYIAFVGDSVGAGHAASPLTSGFANLTMAALPGGPTAYQWGNFSISSQSFVDMATTQSTIVDAWYSARRPRNILVVGQFWINEYSQGYTAAQAIAHARAYTLARRAVGWTVIMVTPLSSAGTLAFRSAITTDLQANLAAYGASALVDFSADAAIGINGSNANLTNWNADQTHPNNAGHAVIESYVEPVVATALQKLSSRVVDLSAYRITRKGHAISNNNVKSHVVAGKAA